MSSLAICNGKMLVDGDVLRGSLLIDSGKIVKVTTETVRADRIIDAAESLVLPGIIDSHVHVAVGGKWTMDPLGDDLARISSAAVVNGVTTMGVYVSRAQDANLVNQVDALLAEIPKAACDVFINALLLPGDVSEETVDELWDRGVRHFKVFLGYDSRGAMTDDGDLTRLCVFVARKGGRVLVHAENGKASTGLQTSLGISADEASKPEFEADGIHRFWRIAQVTGVRTGVVHVSSAESVRTLEWIRDQSGSILECEVQPHYLMLDYEITEVEGVLAKVGPPLRSRPDREALWSGLQSGLLTTVSSDHSARSRIQKTSAPSYDEAPYGGITSSEILLPLMWHWGFESGRLPVPDLMRLMSEQPARAFGISSSKGTIAVGNDADLVLMKPDASPRPMSAGDLRGVSDYLVYPEFSTSGFPSAVIRHGELVASDSSLTDGNASRFVEGRLVVPRWS